MSEHRKNQDRGPRNVGLTWKHAEFLKVALKLDRGEISKDEAVVEDQQIFAKAKPQAEQIAAVDAQRRAAASEALMNAGATLLSNNQPAALVPPPAPTVTQLQCYLNPFGQAGMRCNAQ
jgi:hypothetical protein